jgi:hypothetical protein
MDAARTRIDPLAALVSLGQCVQKSPVSHKKYVVDLMALPLGEREVHNGGMIDASARVRTDRQSVEAQGAARTAAR